MSMGDRGKVMATVDHGSSSQLLPSSGDDDGDNDKKGKKQARPPLPSAPGRDDGTNKEAQTQPPVGPGQNLVQIFTVSLKGIKPCDIGGIVVHEERDTHVIYSYGGEEARRTLGFRLSGPEMAISSEAGCFLEVIPGTAKTMSSDDTLICLDDGPSCYDQFRSKTMIYGGGKVIVEYAVLTGAVEANIEMKLQLSSTGLTYPTSGHVNVCQQNGFSMISVSPKDYVSMPEQSVCSRAPGLGLLDIVHSMPITLPLSRSVFAVKLGETITFQGTLYIGNQLVNMHEELKIPLNVDIIKTVQTPWIHDNGFSYSSSATLIHRNI